MMLKDLKLQMIPGTSLKICQEVSVDVGLFAQDKYHQLEEHSESTEGQIPSRKCQPHSVNES